MNISHSRTVSRKRCCQSVAHEAVLSFQVGDPCHIGTSSCASGKVLGLLQYFCGSVQGKVMTSSEAFPFELKASERSSIIYILSKPRPHYVLMVQDSVSQLGVRKLCLRGPRIE
jgi:hypothetical protein